MAYRPYYPGGWQTGEEGGTDINPAALNVMEAGILNALPKDGGTMSAAITRRINADFETPPAESEWSGAMLMTDEDDYIRGGIYVRRDANGSYRTLLGARGGSPVGWCYIAPRVNGDGTYGYDVSHPAQMLSALGVRWQKVTGTTSAAGVLGVSLSNDRYMVIGAWCEPSTTARLATPFVLSGSAYWSVLIESLSHSPVADTDVTVYVAYIDFGVGAIG